MSAVWLIVSLLGVAGLFLLQGAEFLFVAQLILYIGGVVLLILIALMLVSAQQPAKQGASAKAGRPFLFSACAGGRAALRFRASRSPSIPGGASSRCQYRISSRYFVYALSGGLRSSFPILLVAIIGAVVMGQRREENQA